MRDFTTVCATSEAGRKTRSQSAIALIQQTVTMPSVAETLARRAGIALESIAVASTGVGGQAFEAEARLRKRISIPFNSSSPQGLIEAQTRDPWRQSGKYALGWVYFTVILLVLTAAIHWYNYWTDKIRIAEHKERAEEIAKIASPASGYEHSALSTDRSTRKFFPTGGPVPVAVQEDETRSSPWLIRKVQAMIRFLFYHPIPSLKLHKRLRPLVFPSPGVCLLAFAALAFVMLYSFVPQPLYWQSIEFGSPPVAIRSGMLAVALMPWIIALSMKANFITCIIGIGHERLNVLHRWLAWICLILSLIHTIPFYVTPVWNDGGMQVFHRLLKQQQAGVYIYGTGEASNELIHHNYR